MAAISMQAELISDDPRREGNSGVLAELRDFFLASRELHGLLTVSQAARMLEVNTSQVSQWANTGRLSSRVVSDVRMVSAGEVLALINERQTEIRKSGGRGVKAPSLKEMAQDACRDILSDM